MYTHVQYIRTSEGTRSSMYVVVQFFEEGLNTVKHNNHLPTVQYIHVKTIETLFLWGT